MSVFVIVKQRASYFLDSFVKNLVYKIPVNNNKIVHHNFPKLKVKKYSKI